MQKKTLLLLEYTVNQSKHFQDCFKRVSIQFGESFMISTSVTKIKTVFYVFSVLYFVFCCQTKKKSHNLYNGTLGLAETILIKCRTLQPNVNWKRLMQKTLKKLALYRSLSVFYKQDNLQSH